MQLLPIRGTRKHLRELQAPLRRAQCRLAEVPASPSPRLPRR